MERRASPPPARRAARGAPALTVLEQVVPAGNHFLAAYVVPVEDGCHVAYVKACTDEPPSVWETASAVFKVASSVCPDPQQALDQALSVARLRLALMESGQGPAITDSEFIAL